MKSLVLLALLALVVLSACTVSAADDPAPGSPDAAEAPPVCACHGTGLTINVVHDTGFCPVFDLGLDVTFPGGSLDRNAIRCVNPSILAPGGAIVVPWPGGVSAGELGKIQLSLTGDGGAEARGTATVTADPGSCASITVHTTCLVHVPDAGL